MARFRTPSPQTRLVLCALFERPAEWRYGYELSRLTRLSSGTLYPLLMRLNDRGFLEAKWIEAERPGRPPRHAYRLSSDGHAFARELQTEQPPSSLKLQGALA